MRLFAAVEFNKPIKDYLLEKQKQVMDFSEKGNFTKFDNFHLTLVFLGEVNNEQIPIIKSILDKASQIQKPFTLELDKIGVFPRGNRKILWIGTKKSNELLEIYRALENSFILNGFLTEKHNLVSHITLGREVLLKTTYEELIKNINIEPIMIPVEKISLMESTRINGELKYIPVYVVPFIQ